MRPGRSAIDGLPGSTSLAKASPAARRRRPSGANAAATQAEPERALLQGARGPERRRRRRLPTPAAPTAPIPKGAAAAAPEFKPEEIEAARLLREGRGRAAATSAAAPRHRRACSPARHRRRAPGPARAALDGAGPEAAPAPRPARSGRRRLQPGPGGPAYRGRVEANPSTPASSRPWCASRGGSAASTTMDAALSGADPGATRRTRSPWCATATSCCGDRKDAAAAVDQYREALIWRPDDDDDAREDGRPLSRAGRRSTTTRRQYAVAEARFVEAAKYVTDRLARRGA